MFDFYFLKLNTIIGNRDIFISPPEYQKFKKLDLAATRINQPVEEDLDKVNDNLDKVDDDDKENQFDMSCIMDSIFEVSKALLKCSQKSICILNIIFTF